MLDEKALRKRGFVDGARVVLGDGQEWSLPSAFVRFGSRADGTDGALTDNEIELLCGADEDHPFEFTDALIALSARLLSLNYELSEGDLALLLEYDGHDSRSADRWEEVSAAIRGGGDRTYAKWLFFAIKSNGIDPDGMSLDDAATLANSLVSQGRAIPAGQWVDDAINKRRRREYEATSRSAIGR